ncbi:protease pro-enzyme activation domain-containing protein [Luteibacter aegosomatissinici]|uniref:protease pro-enzyme activation domain-containing protein n=1 Tax=Luteibacter aegosomatissinici TaxID=2911539 RepID=UPI001FFADC31|nr:protease pro-enzyme activation domain-containing protein [Luteibacter aegosomatissinici]UPG93069.1 protease pro-enzyme activation domain-containing protein [Luteibacter aegosomatissinici]
MKIDAFRVTRKTALTVAITLAMTSLGSHAEDAWVTTNTKAALLPATTSQVSTASTAATAATTAVSAGYKLNMTGQPAIEGTAVTALAADHPLHVVIGMKLRNPNQLQAFLRNVTTPGNAAYGKFLSPDQFKAQFGPTEAQVQAVVAHLQQSGFTNIQVAPNNLLIEADGNAGAATTGFHTSIKRFESGGREFFANDAPALVPAALGESVNAVLGLQNVSVKHTLHHVYHPERVTVPGPASSTQAAAAVAAHHPQDFAAIYGGSGVPAATNTAVGIITWGSITQTVTDLNSFTASAGLATVNSTITKVGSGTFANDPDSNGEWSLDSQDIVGIAGGVKQLIFYTSANGNSSSSGITDAGITATYNKAVTDNIAKLINVSLGEDETAAEESGTQAADDAIFQQAVAQGQIFSIASGDAGVYQWSTDPLSGSPGYVANSAGTVKIDLTHYSVSEPASSPYVIQVGGTQLSTSGTTWSGETVWNEGLSAIAPSQGDNNQRLWATGGGTSLYEAAPSWQSSVSSSTKRVGPDLSFDAASSSGALIVVNGSTEQVGGTSLASPLFVGAFARIESAANNAIGFPASKFYAAFPTQTSLLHDVTSGNNGYQSHGYTAATGFDEATGFGSFDIGKLNTYAQANWVSGGGGTTNVPPVANFSFTTSGLTATFTDSSTDSDGSIASHSWNFGDGATSTAASPSHTYTAAGTYSVSETVTDNAGATNTKTSSVTVSSSGGGGGNVLQNGVAVTGLSAAKNAKLNYTVAIPSGAKNLKIAISGGSGDADLYVKFGSAPTTSSYDCRPYVTGNTETCSVTSPQTGTYYVMLNGYAAFSGVTLKATWTN